MVSVRSLFLSRLRVPPIFSQLATALPELPLCPELCFPFERRTVR